MKRPFVSLHPPHGTTFRLLSVFVLKEFHVFLLTEGLLPRFIYGLPAEILRGKACG